MFKKAIRSDYSYVENGNLTSLQNPIEKRPNEFAAVKKIVLRENNKPHMTSQLQRAITERSRLKINQITAVKILIKQLIKNRQI